MRPFLSVRAMCADVTGAALGFADDHLQTASPATDPAQRRAGAAAESPPALCQSGREMGYQIWQCAVEGKCGCSDGLGNIHACARAGGRRPFFLAVRRENGESRDDGDDSGAGNRPAFRWTRRSSRRVTFLLSSFAAKAANPAAMRGDPGAGNRPRRPLDPPVKPAGDVSSFVIRRESGESGDDA